MKLEPMTVSDLNAYIKDKIAEDEFLNTVYIKGEISNFKHHYTGHLYFTLKDENSLIKCIMFKTYTSKLTFIPKDGMKVLILGSVSVFERDGVYQIYCRAMQEDGLGSLYKAYEKLKQDLEKEGLFDKEHKKQIPVFPKIIGVLTSQNGSVIRDIINVSTRRNPNVNIKLLPVPVQGEGAGIKIADAIKFMNDNKIVDVLIVARGGGSLEDLWPFNEEVVARAIYNSEIPVISAVGHETDFTIADFVADLRAPTPSTAAELAVPDIATVKLNISKYNERLKMALVKKLELSKLRYEKVMTSKAFKNPLDRIENNYLKLDNYIKILHLGISSKFKDNKNKFVNVISKLDSLSPLKTLSRGYTITQKNGKIIKSVKELEKEDVIELKFIDGNKEAVVK